MAQNEPVLRMKGDDGEYNITPSNGSLYRFLGENSLYDYVFMQTGETEDGDKEGSPIFIKGFLEPGTINQVTHFMLTRGFECHLNLDEPMDIIKAIHQKVCDRQAHIDVPDTIPEDWGG